MDHMLLHYQIATRLWWDIFSWFGVSWTMPKSMLELMFRWKSGTRRRATKLGMLLLLLLLILDHLERESM